MIRDLEYWSSETSEARPIRVTITSPVLANEATGGGDWSCTLSIEGFDGSYKRSFFNVDPLAALLSTAAIAPHVLRTFVAKGGRLTWLGNEDLGFPLLRPPSHRWMFRHRDDGEPRGISVVVGAPERDDNQWSILLSLVDEGNFEVVERRVRSTTWAGAFKGAGEAVPALLSDFVDKVGGGTLEEIIDAPVCQVPSLSS